MNFNGNLYSHRFLRDICINFILESCGTCSIVVSRFSRFRYGHPHVELTIIEEIKTVSWNSRKKENIKLFEITFMVEEQKKIHYMHAVLSEALRIYPFVPVDHKKLA